ncbi:cytochrome P450 [Russula earlei]|uniref:Cytochrome P450 n=1 Tax=Russula earlei TaxID=71964 RepID=A0ACC0UD16_9AGAM|nr:cytochrome P450 [Russula earlei]
MTRTYSPARAEAGTNQTKPGLFKLPMFRRWVVVPASIELIDDVRKAPDDVLSNDEPLAEFFQTKYTFSVLNIEDPYHRGVIRSKLARNTTATFDLVHDELVGALSECIPIGEGRNHDYQAIAASFATNLMKTAIITRMFPEFLKPLVPRIISKLPSQIRQTKEFIRPIVEERFAKMEQLGETWDDPPSDMLMWLMDEAKGVERSLEGLARRLLLVNFASIHTTSIVLYRLLAHPEYVEPLRQEVEAVVAKEGWTKAGMDKMTKIDSFVRETQRLNGLFIPLRPFTFSNGVTLPAGTLVSLPVGPVHRDEGIYPNAEEFDGFRFSKLRDSEGDAVLSKHQMSTASSELLAFGFGRHSCPGRFLAAYEIKALFAHILAEYDVKFEEGKGVPPDRGVGITRITGNTTVLFRKRQK